MCFGLASYPVVGRAQEGRITRPRLTGLDRGLGFSLYPEAVKQRIRFGDALVTHLRGHISNWDPEINRGCQELPRTEGTGALAALSRGFESPKAPPKWRHSKVFQT